MTADFTELRIVSRGIGGAPMVRDGRIAAAAAAWYLPRPRVPDEWRAHVEGVRASAQPGWAEALAPAIRAGGAAAERLARVAGRRGVVITTGQQPGLFGGPLYTWWKALSALAVADAVEAAAGVPAAPVFWAATDDADFAEASETFVAVPGGLERLALPRVGADGTPLADVPLGAVRGLVRRLAAAAGSGVYPQALELAAQAYGDGQTIGSAYVALLRGLLEPLGIAVLDAAHPAVRAAGSPVLARALRESAALERSLLQRERDLRSAGFRAQVPLVRGRSLVFSSRDGRRERIPIAAAAEAAGVPDQTRGPNVLLRPVMERAILPTAAYVAGPGELAYFAQVSAVADALDVARPLAVPRWSGTVLEPHVQRLLDRHALDIEGLVPAGAAEGAVARQAIAPEVREAMGRLRGATGSALETLSRALEASGAPAVPPAVLSGAGRDVERRVARLERRIIAAAKREQTDAMRDVATLRAALLPEGKPQERVLNLLPLLARHGPRLLDRVRAAADRHARGLTGLEAASGSERRATPIEAGARERTG
ncbi:MAG TPA: bacillithiol biosynthesis BshC [Gemmatimonadaceae bacterium]|nr:bacillithiol biosynthesis BshC [Gemmatimonadaceae bacterium]